MPSSSGKGHVGPAWKSAREGAIEKNRHYLAEFSHGGADHGPISQSTSLITDIATRSSSDNQPFFFKEAFFSGHSGSQITHVVIGDRDPDFFGCAGIAAKPKK
jgi:hypothetical protein